MKLQKSKKIRRIVLITIAGIVSLPILYIVILAISWLHSDHANAQRLKTLQADGILHCNVTQIAPWHGEDVDTAGGTHGIGFGGTSPTLVAREYYMNGADTKGVLNAFAGCAQADGWQMSQTFDNSSLQATKTFPGGWLATLLIAIEKQAPHNAQPVVEVQLETDGT